MRVFITDRGRRRLRMIPKRQVPRSNQQGNYVEREFDEIKYSLNVKNLIPPTC